MARFLEGEFSSLEQSKTNPSYFDIHLVTCLVKAPSYGNLVLYVEQASGNNLSQPYRQRLYVVTGDGSTVRSEVWAPMNSQAWIGTCSKPGLTEVQIGDFALRSGCDVLLQPTATGFVGGTEGTECQSTLAGASYATSKVTLESDLLLSWDQGFSSNGAQVWGATAGAYRFDRLSPMTDAAQWLEAVEALQ